ncbi:amidase [Rhizobiales bacterium]|uniref:amidase n=1 Tax=Hongsoonwoonella zoysiae TaxID=2821844 RepID=UPI001560A011|nr:amidase [Hongsoonwoonella zoysiae]NRG17931.1 amidase [Hongsoonwoonella zoysiae]
MASGFWKSGVGKLAAAYAQGLTDPLSVVTELEARIARLNPEINAYVAIAPDLHTQAEESRDRLARGAPRSPLEGIPIAVKDNLSVAGMPAAWGSAVFADEIRMKDELPVERLRKAGAILVGKTNTPEFAVEGYTGNARFGVTGNPWNVKLTPGGSSGGSASAVASGLAQAAVGTDGGGSIRRPAGHTGLFGLKPTIGSVPRAGGLPQILMDFEVVGPLARSVRDLSLLFNVLAGPDRSDPVSRPVRLGGTSARKLRILSVERFGDNPCDANILASFAGMEATLCELGHSVTSGELPLDLEPLNAFWGSFAQVGLAHLVAAVPGMAEKASPKYLAMATEGKTVPAPELFAALQAVRDLRAATSALFGEWDVVMTPSAAAQPWPAGESHPGEIDGREVGPRGHAVYTGWVNAAGHPAITVPARPDPSGLPVGVQFIGDLWTERLLLSLAAEVEAAGDGWRWPSFALT